MKKTNWRRFPICLLGYDISRWEGYEFNKPIDIIHPDFQKKLLVFERRDLEGPSHIQYGSKLGFLITWPLCFHFWWLRKPQRIEINSHGTSMKVPGSEKVLFISIGWARWDCQDHCYMIPRCFLGFHYD